MSRRRKRKAQQQRRTVVIDIPAPVDVPPLLPGPESGEAGDSLSVPEEYVRAVERARVCWALGGRELPVLDVIKAEFPDLDAERVGTLAAQQIAENGELDKRIIRGLVFEMLRETYRMAMEDRDASGCIQACKAILSVTGS